MRLLEYFLAVLVAIIVIVVVISHMSNNALILVRGFATETKQPKLS